MYIHGHEMIGREFFVFNPCSCVGVFGGLHDAGRGGEEASEDKYYY
jgi:hypothetical protein